MKSNGEHSSWMMLCQQYIFKAVFAHGKRLELCLNAYLWAQDQLK